MEKPILIIDPGHGGTDSGAKAFGHLEKDFNLQISLYQFNRFVELNVPVMMTRVNDISLTPTSRTNIVKQSGASFCISNHINASGGDGAEIIHSLDPSDDALAYKIYNAIVGAGQNGRRVFNKESAKYTGKDWYYMIRDTKPVTTIIIEYAFIDNYDDLQQLSKFWQVLAEAVVKAFCEFAGITYREPNTATKEVIQALRARGFLSNPEYWISNAVPGGTVSGENAAALLLKIAAELQRVDEQKKQIKTLVEKL